MTPSPFVTCYLDDGERVYFDVDCQNNLQIVDRLTRILGKSKQVLAAEDLASQKKDNPANFGPKAQRFCICNEPGQIPCSSFVPVPKHWRGKYIHGYEDEEEQ